MSTHTEADNRRIGERFRRLPEDVPLWRTWGVVETLAVHLGLSHNAASHAVSMLRVLREADWRGDGRPVTYVAIKTRARRYGLSERTINRWENELIRAGLCFRTCRHARRHGGGGDADRAIGLDWSPLGARMEELIAAVAEVEILDRMWEVARTAIYRERDRIEDALARAIYCPELGPLIDAFVEIPCRRLAATLPLAELQRRLARLKLVRDAIETVLDTAIGRGEPASLAERLRDEVAVASQGDDPVDDSLAHSQESGQSDISDRHLNTTTETYLYSCNKRTPPNGGDSIRQKDRAHARSCLENENAAARPVRNLKIRSDEEMSPADLLHIAPERWRDAIDDLPKIDWSVIGYVAAARRAELGVSEHAWSSGVARMGSRRAAICLAVLDANREHPTHPVRSVGGAFVAMTRRDANGRLDLASSVRWIAARRSTTASGTPPPVDA